jgi:Arc/MetJ-type ribon-helix-helix transcriptional regulator
MSVHEIRPKISESEKITVNLGLVDLGQIDLLVQEGFYSNRTDLIRKSLVLGVQHYSRADLEAILASGQTLNIHVLGLASIAADVSPELALASIESLVVLGALHASPAVKAALGSRIN